MSFLVQWKLSDVYCEGSGKAAGLSKVAAFYRSAGVGPMRSWLYTYPVS